MKWIGAVVLLASLSSAALAQTTGAATIVGTVTDTSGAVIAGGMLYVNSGYSSAGGMPGNVLARALSIYR